MVVGEILMQWMQWFSLGSKYGGELSIKAPDGFAIVVLSGRNYPQVARGMVSQE